MATFSDIELLCYIGTGILGVLIVLTLILIGITVFYIKKMAIPEISQAKKVIPTALESLNYAEVPIAIVAVIADHMQITLSDVASEYAKDAAKRRTIVLQTFKKDPITDLFMDNFPSKFIQHGYIGEERLN